MGVKGKLMMSVLFAFIGLSLITGGTTAYFNDKQPTNNTFTTGVLDLGINKETIIDLEGLIPGDTMHGNFELTNDGNVDIEEVMLHSSYEVMDKDEDNQGDDLGDHIMVEYIYHVNNRKNVVLQKTLSELMDHPTQILADFPADDDVKRFGIKFSFIDNGEDQNHFQGDELKLNWEFQAVQRKGDPDFQ